MWFWCLILLASEINYAKKQDCVDIVCDHDNVNVCGVRTEGKEVSFRLFQDECALRKFECESGTKGFKTINVKYCNHALNLDVGTNNSVESFATEKEEVEDRETELNTDSTFSLTDTTDTLERTCIKCYCDSDSNKICAIRADSSNFIVRWFPDKCHMLQYNCENNLNFTLTDTYICIGDEKSENWTVSEEMDTKRPDDLIDTNIELLYKMDTVVFENPACSQDDCISDNKVICAVNPDDKGFVIRRFDDECHMLQYNCEKHVNFTTIDEVVCVGGDNFTINYTPGEESKTIEKYFTVEEEEEATDVEITEKTKLLEKMTLSQENTGNSSLPNNVVVSTFDLNEESINQTVNNFFAASHSTGIPIKKLVNEDTRRMIIQHTGPFNIFVPRAFIPANWTKPSLRNESKKYPEWTPLLKYCYHKCPEQCPDFYRPVCGAKLTDTKQTPFVFYKNHCYMDIAKCKMSWGGYTGYNYTELEEMGFIFCGGYKMMNMVYMYPLIKILQRMGRLNKKGRVHFVMKNLGQFPIPLQG